MDLLYEIEMNKKNLMIYNTFLIHEMARVSMPWDADIYFKWGFIEGFFSKTYRTIK
jgi:hypothetical protein